MFNADNENWTKPVNTVSFLYTYRHYEINFDTSSCLENWHLLKWILEHNLGERIENGFGLFTLLSGNLSVFTYERGYFKAYSRKGICASSVERWIPVDLLRFLWCMLLCLTTHIRNEKCYFAYNIVVKTDLFLLGFQ